LCVELVLPMPSAVGEPATPFVDGAAVSAARDKPLKPMQRTKAAAAIPVLRPITVSLNDLAKANRLVFGNAQPLARFVSGPKIRQPPEWCADNAALRFPSASPGGVESDQR